MFVEVTVRDAPGETREASVMSSLLETAPIAAPVIVERQGGGIEVELVGGRRVRFLLGTELKTVRAMVEMLEGASK